MKNKSSWIGILVLLVIILILINVFFFSKLFGKNEKNGELLKFEILHSSWAEYNLRDVRYLRNSGIEVDPIDWDSHCSINCRQSHIYCKSGATEKCDNPLTPCETNSWYLFTEASGNFFCSFEIDGLIQENDEVYVDKEITRSKTVSYLDPREDHLIKVCCRPENGPKEEQICRAIFLPAKCEIQEIFCGDGECDSLDETCKNCPSDCGKCKEDSEKYWYEFCIEGNGDIVYNKNEVITESDFDEKEMGDTTMNCKPLKISIGDTITFRLRAESEGIIFSYDKENDERIKGWGSFGSKKFDNNRICTFIDPDLSFECERLHLFEE
jgi:hypothetical protein